MQQYEIEANRDCRWWLIYVPGSTTSFKTSAAAKMRHPEVSRRLRPLIEGGVVATTTSLDAEALHDARGPAEYEQL